MSQNIFVSIETSKGSHVHVRKNIKSGELVVRGESNEYPCNYGHVVETTTESGEEVDVILFEYNSLPVGTIVEARVVGMLPVSIDGDAIDNKLVVVPTYRQEQNIVDIDTNFLNTCSEFIQTYKLQTTSIEEWVDAELAKVYLAECETRYADQHVYM